MTPPTTTLRKSTSTVMSSSGSLTEAAASSSSSPSSSLDFFHSTNSKMLSKALSTLSAAQPRSTTLLPSVTSSSSSSSSSIKLLNEAFEVSSRNTNYLDSIKKSFFSSANDKKKGELQKLMEDVLIEQRKEQLMEELEEENTRFKRPQSPRRENSESANIITELLTPKTSTTPTIRVINSSSSDSRNTNLIEQTKNETLRALISGPYSTKKIPLPPPPPQLPLTTLKATAGQLVAAGSCCSPAERRLNELKHEIIDLVSTNTASSFPVEENTSSPAANKKLVQELDEKEASMTKAMNKNMSFLESTLTRARGKKEIIENFLKLKSLLNTGGSSPTSEADSVSGGVRKLSMRSAAASTTSGHKFVLDREQIRRIGAAKMDNSVKRLNLYSSIASKYFPKTSNKWDEENSTDQQEQDKHRQKHVEIVELDGDEEYIDENDDEDEIDDDEEEDDIEMEDEQYMDDEEEDEEDDDDNDEEENNMIENGEEEEEENELENILIRKRLTEPGIYVRGKGRGKYECPKCMWRARKLCVLKRHIMVSHANFKPFLCTYCKVAFKTKGNLVRHTKTKAHLRACSKLGMSPGDDEVTRISSKNIDSHQLNKQLKIDKRIKVS